MHNPKILVIQGHPDRRAAHFCHALADSYVAGTQEAGFDCEVLCVADLALAPLESEVQWRSRELPDGVKRAQEAISRADHLVIVYPLWLGTMPALLKGFFEQVLRPGFAFSEGEDKKLPRQLLTGKSARIVITMGMPALLYRWFFFAHGLKNLERNILRFCGIKPIRESLIGLVAADPEKRAHWLDVMRRLGQKGA